MLQTELSVKKSTFTIFKEATKNHLEIVGGIEDCTLTVRYRHPRDLFNAGEAFNALLKQFETLENSFDLPF